MENIFSKKMQSVFKAIYASGIKEYWEDKNMQDFCIKRISVFVPFKNNTIIVGLEKPLIQTEFWFGYSDIGQGDSYEECNENVHNALKNPIDYFINANLFSINNNIEKVEKLIKSNNTESYRYYFAKEYSAEKKHNPVSCVCLKTDFHNLEELNKDKDKYLSVDELKIFLEALKEDKKIFEKRLNSYIKRYGDKKLIFQTYWLDR